MANRGTAPVDYTSAVGQVRLLIGDTDPANVENGTGDYVFWSDDEIAALIVMFEGNPKRAAVQMLRTIALTPSLKLKKWTSADLMVDGPAITEQLLDAALALENSLNAAARHGAQDFAISAAVGGRAARLPRDVIPWWPFAHHGSAQASPLELGGVPPEEWHVGREEGVIWQDEEYPL